MSELADFAEVIVVANRDEFQKNSSALIGHEKVIVDLVRIRPERQVGINYRGICW